MAGINELGLILTYQQTTMFLAKFTDEKWKREALKGKSLRIGSFLYYREIENETFRDEDEGQGSVVYKSKLPLTEEIYNKIFADSKIRLANGWTIETGGIPLISEKSTFNTLIFSCSLLDSPKEISEFKAKFKKDSVCFIKDIWKFADGIAKKIHNKIITEFDKSPELFSFDKAKLRRLQVLPVIGKVTYTDEDKDRIVSEVNVENFNPLTFNLETVFRKPTRFAHEKEFRFIWVINLGDIQSNKEEDVDLVSTNWRCLDISPNKTSISSKAFYLKKEQITDRKGNQLI
ncbi:MAG TPA: hypothetical protein PKD67_12485 [Ignavibacteriaceae bacterium]|nr:hypothetical protein [Ignavibacteriaceae bacterium]